MQRDLCERKQDLLRKKNALIYVEKEQVGQIFGEVQGKESSVWCKEKEELLSNGDQSCSGKREKRREHTEGEGGACYGVQENEEGQVKKVEDIQPKCFPTFHVANAVLLS